MNQRYFHAVMQSGAVPWMIPLHRTTTCERCARSTSALDGILIPGGVDMDPATYGEPSAHASAAASIRRATAWSCSSRAGRWTTASRCSASAAACR